MDDAAESGRLWPLALYPVPYVLSAVVLVAWPSSDADRVFSGRIVAGGLLFGVLCTLPGYLVTVALLAARLRALGTRAVAAVAATVAVGTPLLFVVPATLARAVDPAEARYTGPVLIACLAGGAAVMTLLAYAFVRRPSAGAAPPVA